MNIVHRCNICEADFAAGALDKAGKCSVCRVQYPTVRTRQEAFALNKPELHLGAKLTEERVRQIAREEFNAIRAEIKAKAEAMKSALVPPLGTNNEAIHGLDGKSNCRGSMNTDMRQETNNG